MFPYGFGPGLPVDLALMLGFFASLYALIARRRVLNPDKRPPAPPTIFGFERNRAFFGAFVFIFTGRHRQLGDQMASRLVIACRVLLGLHLLLFSYLFWRFGLPSFVAR